jgi:hypothetical protein
MKESNKEIKEKITYHTLPNGITIAQVPISCDYSKGQSGIIRGIRMVIGVSIFMIIKGIKYKFEKFKKCLK